MRSAAFGMAAVAAAALGAFGAAEAKTFRYSTSGDILTMDPHSQNEGPTNAMKSNIHDGLVLRTDKLEVIPGLAESWSLVNPTTWRFKLRAGVKFHDGTPLTADDVVFSFQRNIHQQSDMKNYLSTVAEVKKVDDLTVDYVTKGPDPILLQNLTLHFVMSKAWAEKNNTTAPVLGSTTETYATRHTNGTGPFILKERVPDTRTTLVPNPNYWRKVDHNLTEAIFRPIGNAATRVSALLSGEIDMMFPVPLQDVPRVNQTAGVKVMEGPELRTIFLGFDQWRDESLDMKGTGKNPFKDVRVRKAFYQAVDMEAIRRVVMRNASANTGLMIAPGIEGFDTALNARAAFDPEASKKLLAEAGYPNGFPVTLDCPNDRYVNDEAICQAVIPMLARVGIQAKLNAQTKGKHFDKIGKKENNNTSFYMLGWTPGTYDGHNALVNLMITQGQDVGSWNSGRYSNAKVEKLTQDIAVELDLKKRVAMMQEAFKIHKDDFGHLPLHQQALAWGVRDSVASIAQPANDAVWLTYVKMK
ncbi:MAG: ABC transporter substrate-binding protein [Alphaproteobacteria bacterium]|nr:ABC transporter substrate-binding protein [Alphaproteobacteria bacterium]